MGVTGKRQCDARRHSREDIRLVGEQQQRVVGFDRAQCSRQIVDAAKPVAAKPQSDLIAKAGEPNHASLVAKHHGIIFQRRDVCVRQRLPNLGEIVHQSWLPRIAQVPSGAVSHANSSAQSR